MDLLVIAFYLSVLSYYLGTLIYMLPIPFYGLKKWGPQLMIDGIFSAILVFSYTFILWLINYMGIILGIDWNSFYQWLFNEVNTLVTTIVMLKLVGIGLSSIGLSFLSNSMLSPLISSLTYLLIFLVTVSMLVTALVYLAPTLLALGILLHSIPFRITRSSGAMLISLIVVFSIGTPLMPEFINLITPPTMYVLPTSNGFVFANIFVYGRDYRGLSYSLYEIYDARNNKLLARYQTDINGYINASSLETGIPYIKHRVRICFAGYYYEAMVDPSKYNSSNGSFNISMVIPNIIVIRPLRIVVLENLDNYNYLHIDYVNSTTIHLVLNTSSTASLLLIMLGNDNALFFMDSMLKQPVESYSYEWGGVGFLAENFTIPVGYHNIYLTILGSTYPKPSFEEILYGKDYLGISRNDLTNLVYPVVTLIYRLFIGPLIYVSILFSASLALSKLLGGSSSRIARIVVTGI